MYVSKLSKRLVSLALLLLLLFICQSASATMKASFPPRDRVKVNDVNGALKYRSTYDENTGHLSVEILPGTDWAAYQQAVGPFNPDCRQPIEIQILPPQNAVEMCCNNFSQSMTDAKLYDYLVNDDWVWWGEPEYCAGYMVAGHYVPQTGVISPVETVREENQGITCAWRNGGGNIFLFERMTVSISWASREENKLSDSSITTFVPLKGNMVSNPVDGLAYKNFNYDQETGYVNIVVDTKNTDWTKVMASSYDAASGVVHGPGATFTFDSANPPTMFKHAGGLDKDVYNSAWEYGLPNISMSAPLGRYDESTGLFFPEPTVSRRPGIAVRWDSDDPHYRALMYLTFDDYTPIPLSLSKLSQDSVIPDTSHATVQHSLDGSWVVYTDTDTTKKTLVTGVRLPAEGLKVSCRTDDVGEITCEIKDGVVLLPFELPGREVVKESSYTLLFRNADDSFHSLSVVSIRGIQGSPKPYPSYYGEMHPYPTANLSAELLGGIPGTSLTYDPALGILHFVVDSEKLAAAKSYDPTLAQAKVTILPVEGATHYRFGGVAGTNIYDPNRYGPQEPSGDIRPITGYRYDQDVGFDYTDFFTAESFTLHNGKAAWYITNSFPEYTGPYAGRVDCVYWYTSDDENAQPFHTSYFIKKFDPIATITESKIVSSRNDVLKKPVSSPAMIIESRAGAASTLQASLYPSADNTQYYELEMLDASGKPVDLDQKATLFIPYPDNLDQESFMALNPAIIHYTDDMEIVEVFEDDIEYVEKGMFITVRSLSPYVLSWEEVVDSGSGIVGDGAGVDALPDTGDHSAPAMWLMLAGASLLVLAASVRRRTQRQN